ncbi:MAG: hypothetical protein HUU16_11035 [Candidatus Omnitrophica bacterium]|nr:hypothetical protein [Candidatus Omnitrophota bacterium]
MRPDPTIDGIRTVRKAIWDSVGRDPRRLVDHYMQLQTRHPELLVHEPVTETTLEAPRASKKQ